MDFMNKKIKSVFVCSECGFESAKWNGICPSCNQGNTMIEEIRDTSISKTKNKSLSQIFTSSNITQVAMNSIDINEETRYFDHHPSAGSDAGAEFPLHRPGK